MDIQPRSMPMPMEGSRAVCGLRDDPATCGHWVGVDGCGYWIRLWWYGEQLLGLQESGSKAVCKVWLTLLHVL